MSVKKKIYQYDINGYFIKEWDSPIAAARALRPGYNSPIKMNRKKGDSERSIQL